MTRRRRRMGEIFPATGHSLRGSFYAFWQAHGGLERFGYPITDEIIEPDAGSGRPRAVQYFERARFEFFPEFAGTPNQVQLGLLGVSILSRFGVDWQQQRACAGAPPDCLYFEATGHSLRSAVPGALGGAGRASAARPADHRAVPATHPETGQVHTVQYFERARFEHHPRTPVRPARCCSACLGARC